MLISSLAIYWLGRNFIKVEGRNKTGEQIISNLPPFTSFGLTSMTPFAAVALYQMGSPSEGITALRLCKSSDVNHFDTEGRNLSRMRRVMKVVEHFARTRSVWKPLTAGPDYWDGETVTKV